MQFPLPPGLPAGALAYQDHWFHLLRAGEVRRKGPGNGFGGPPV